MAGGFELALFCDLLWAADGTQARPARDAAGASCLWPAASSACPRAPVSGRAGAHGCPWRKPSSRLSNSTTGESSTGFLAGEELHAAAEKFAKRLAQGPTRAFAVVKELARASIHRAVCREPTACSWKPPSACSTPTIARNGIESFLASGSGTASFVGH